MPLRGYALLPCLLLAAASLPVRAAKPAQGEEFVRVQAGRFSVGGQPFRFVGANVSVMHGPIERERYEAVLDAVKADGLQVIRLWALGEIPAPGAPHSPHYAFRIGEDGWLEESFAHLDRVLSAAAARGLRVIVVLANRWKDYGGIASYLRWSGEAVERDEAGEPSAQSLSAFFRCARCQEQYQEHVRRVVGRINAVSQQPYRDDPTIMAWELINEASAFSAREEEAMLRWVQANARFIRQLDPNHLISAGHIGYRSTREREVWRAVQSLPEIDFADAHVYPETDARVTNTARLARALDDPLALAALVIRKPLVFGEFGFARRHDRKASAERVSWLQAFLSHAEQRGAAGALVWLYEPGENPLRKHSITPRPDDLHSVRVRRLLRASARAFARHPDAGVPQRWSRDARLPRFAPRDEARGVRAPHRGFVPGQEGLQLEIEPGLFARGSFEQMGYYQGHALDTLWGRGAGYVSYRFEAPPGLPRGVEVAARISSELPGAGDGQDTRDGSDVEISLDGELLGTVRARPDDGVGEVVRVELSDARALRRIFGRRGPHELRFTALPSSYAGGLCIYGAPSGAQPVPEPVARDLQAVRIVLRTTTDGET
jgi:mannan endo-1,4-beta-mannosidase